MADERNPKDSVTWRWLGPALATLVIAIAGWVVTRTSNDIEAIRNEIDVVRKEFRSEVETLKRDRVSDLSRLSHVEAKLDGLRDGQIRTEAKIDALLAAQKARK